MRGVVIGGGWAGQLSALALARTCASVVVLERNSSKGGLARGSSPHSEHLHNLLSAGSIALEKLLPGFKERLASTGAIRGNIANETHVFEAGMWFPTRPLGGLEIWSAPRSAFDDVVREELHRWKNVTILQDTRASALETKGGRVTGVAASSRGRRVQAFPADLVVDASGGAFKGSPQTPVSRSASDRWYASIEVMAPLAMGNQFWMVFPWKGSRGALASPTGAGTAKVSVSGSLALDRVPNDWRELAEYVTGLEEPLGTMSRLLAACTPIADDISIFRQPVATWRHFEQVRVPLGFAPIGDSIARLSPLIGQGLSVSARQALALLGWAGAARASGSDALRAQQAYLEEACHWIWRAWSLQLLSGEKELNAHHSRRSALKPDQLRQLALKAVENEDIHRAYVGLWHLMTPPDQLSKILSDNSGALRKQ